MGVCDGLVNNAGVYGSMGNFCGSSIDEWVEAINVNFLGSVYMTHALLPHFINRNYGKIVQLSGGGAISPSEPIILCRIKGSNSSVHGKRCIRSC